MCIIVINQQYTVISLMNLRIQTLILNESTEYQNVLELIKDLKTKTEYGLKDTINSIENVIDMIDKNIDVKCFARINKINKIKINNTLKI